MEFNSGFKGLSVFLPFCILACNFLSCFTLVFTGFFPTFMYFFLSCCYVVIYLQIHFVVIIALVFRCCYVIFLFTLIFFFFCLYLFLYIPFLSLLFPTYAGFATPSFGHSFDFLHSLTFTLRRIPILDSTNHSDQLFPLLALSARPHCTKTKFWREEDNWSRCRESNTDCLLSVITVAVSTHVTCTVDYKRVAMIYHVCWLTLSRQFCLTWLRLITGSRLP